MALKFFITLKNNWKKSVFAAGALAYGVHYAWTQIECNKVMTSYCQKALQYGNTPISAAAPLRRIIVILNPAADKRKAKKYFEKYCAPILHLSGAIVDIKVTKGEGDARKLMESLKERVDAIVVAGGDGTISEVITGLLRGFNHDCSLARRIPIGILPLGQNNHIAKSIFSQSNEESFIEKVNFMADASMTIVQEARSSEKNVLCIQVLEDDSKEKNRFYALNSIEWGNLKTSEVRKSKYWYFGPLKSYATYMLNGFSIQPIKAQMSYTSPCSGCKRCHATRSDIKVKPKKQWYQIFVPKNTAKSKNYNLIENADCGAVKQDHLQVMDLMVTAMPSPHMTILKGQENYEYQDFVQHGWNYEKTNQIEARDKIYAQQVDIVPETHTEESGQETNRSIYIDNEEFEVKPLRITLLQNTIQVYNP